MQGNLSQQYSGAYQDVLDKDALKDYAAPATGYLSLFHSRTILLSVYNPGTLPAFSAKARLRSRIMLMFSEKTDVQLLRYAARNHATSTFSTATIRPCTSDIDY